MAVETKQTSVKTGSLILDPKNSRIPADHRSEDQRQLLHQLLEHEDVRGLASSIAKLGLFPNERLVVLRTGRRFVVLEGNRRVAAIKLLINPELAPSNSQVSHFRRLSSKANLHALATLDVVVVPNRISAAPIIASLHIGGAKRQWSSLQQARFYSELAAEGQTLAEIAEDSGQTLGHVRSFLRAEKLHRIALTLDYDLEIRKKIESPKYPLTTLERFLEFKSGRKFLGIELDDELGFRGIVHPERFKAVLNKVAADSTESGITRRINKDTDMAKYAAAAEEKIPKTRIKGKFNPDLLLNGEDEKINSEEIETRKKPSKTTTKISSSVIPRGFSCASKNDRVRAVFNEIKSMKIVNQRNSTGVMLRVLIDISLWDFIKKQGHDKAATSHFDRTGRKQKNNADWTPPLRDLISYAVEKKIFPGMTADGYKSIRSLASRDSKYMITIDGFNEFTHNPHVTPTEGDLRALWQRAEPMLEIILN